MATASISSLPTTSPSEEFFRKILLPGDNLFYCSKGVFSWIIRHASNSPISHCEMYMGNGESFASRDGKGVQTYSLRTDGLVLVLRPKMARLDFAAVRQFHREEIGSKYDWVGLFRSFVRNKWGVSDSRWWCSEYLAVLDDHLGNPAFDEATPRDAISPGDFPKSDNFKRIYQIAGLLV